MDKFKLTDWEYTGIEKRLIQLLMRAGQKQKATCTYEGVLLYIKREKKQNPRTLIVKALNIVRPLLEVRSVRVAGNTYMVPVPVSIKKQDDYALRWIIENAMCRHEHSIASRIAHEVLDILAGKGRSIEKRDNLHKMAEGNQAFVHFRW